MDGVGGNVVLGRAGPSGMGGRVVGFGSVGAGI